MDRSQRPAGEQLVTLKTLNTKITNALIVGIIIARQPTRVFNNKKNGAASTRGVWNFTLRDSITEYINVTVWGSAEYVQHLYEKFCTGDFVNIHSPSITIRQLDDKNEQFRPSVTSPFHLTLNEGQSHISLNESNNYHQFLILLHYPTKPANECLTLADVYNNGGTIRGEYVDLMVAIRTVGKMQTFPAKTGDRTVTKRVITVLDQSHLNMPITLWEMEYIKRAERWKPRETILLLADVRVEWSDWERSFGVAVTCRSIVTEEPAVPQAEELRLYASTAPIYDADVVNRIAADIPDPSSIRQVMSCRRLLRLALIRPRKRKYPGAMHVMEQQFTAVIYAIVMQLDLNGYTEIITSRCKRCGMKVQGIIGATMSERNRRVCGNLECPMGSGAELSQVELAFNIVVQLADHTGAIPTLRLCGKYAEQALGYTVQDFLNLSDDDKALLKWKFLLERCVTRVIVLKRNRRPPLISILTMARADVSEAAIRTPLY